MFNWTVSLVKCVYNGIFYFFPILDLERLPPPILRRGAKSSHLVKVRGEKNI
jgi:hypothetical protein